MIRSISNNIFQTFGLSKIKENTSFKGYRLHKSQGDLFIKGPSKNTPVSKVVVSAGANYEVFKNKMQTIFYSCCESPISNPKQSVGVLKFNNKKFYETLKDIDKNCKSAKEARDFIDSENIICGRIILNKGDKVEGNKILSRLIKSVNEGKIKVQEVRVYRERNLTNYVSRDKVAKLVDAAVNNNIECTRTEKRKATGYHGVHIIFTLDDGFKGELQIMGSETEKLKDAEDILYRFSKGKPIKKEFNSLKDIYNCLSDKQKENLIQYTKEAYFAQREKELGLNFEEDLLPLQSSKYDLPKMFDFNYLAKMDKKIKEQNV